MRADQITGGAQGASLGPYSVNELIRLQASALASSTRWATPRLPRDRVASRVQFRAEGADVLLVDLNEQAGRAKAEASGSAFFRADVSKRADWEGVLAEVKQRFNGRLTTVVNNAGWSYAAKSTLEVTEADFEKVFAINVASFFHSVAVLVPFLQELGQGGTIITISSVCVLSVVSTIPYSAPYQTAALRPRPNLTWSVSTAKSASSHTPPGTMPPRAQFPSLASRLLWKWRKTRCAGSMGTDPAKLRADPVQHHLPSRRKHSAVRTASPSGTR
jgi:hypothetical protein